MAIYLCLFVAQAAAAQFVGLSAEVESTCWPAQGGEERKAFTSKCVVGTNIWMIGGEFLGNGAATLWFTGSNIISHCIVTKTVPPEKAPGWLPARAGEHFSRILNVSKAGRPNSFGAGSVVWLAFCSGRYLKLTNLPIALPIGQDDPLQYSRSYRQTISVFDDELGLPSRVEVYSLEKALVCRYEAEGSTLVDGWRFPKSFKFIQYRVTPKGTWMPYYSVVARLTSAERGKQPEIPAEVTKEISE